MSLRKAVLVTGHFPEQKRRGSLLWLCDGLRARGWQVTIVTVGYSWISRLRGDRRISVLDERPRPGVTRFAPDLTGVFGYAPLHPFSLRHPLLDRILEPFQSSFLGYWAQRLPERVVDADLIVVESGPPVMLSRILRDAAPKTPMVYRVNDDAEVLGLPRSVRTAEQDHAPLFDRISVASPMLAQRFSDFRSLEIDPMGVPVALLERPMDDPFAAGLRADREVVCAGTTQFDMGAVRLMADLRPTWRFHVFGRLPDAAEPVPENLVLHGETPFERMLPYLRFADIGLAPYLDKPGVAYQTHHSNRMLLYRYLGLPILGPDALCDSALPRLIGYAPGDRASIERALGVVETLRPGPRDQAVGDWSVLCDRILSTRRLHGAGAEVSDLRLWRDPADLSA